MPSTEIVDVSVDELQVDGCNIRGGAWDYDEELVRSVKQRGIALPLLVRPVKTPSKAKYGIVCGSRRFNAALEAGLEEVPCIIKEMTDVEAMGRSLEENILRKDIPLWQNIEWIGMMYETLKKDSLKLGSEQKFSKMDARYDEIVRRTGLNKDKVRDYVKIALYLSEEVRALLRPRESRTQFQEERLKGLLFRTQSPFRTLTVYKTMLIFNELNELPIEKQVQVATYILSKTREASKQIVELVKKYPDKELLEIEQILRKEQDTFYRSVGLDKQTLDALSKACLHKQKELPDLMREILKEWLRKNLYLSHISE